MTKTDISSIRGVRLVRARAACGVYMGSSRIRREASTPRRYETAGFRNIRRARAPTPIFWWVSLGAPIKARSKAQQRECELKRLIQGDSLALGLNVNWALV